MNENTEILKTKKIGRIDAETQVSLTSRLAMRLVLLLLRETHSTTTSPASAWSHNCGKQSAAVWLMLPLFATFIFLLHSLTTNFNWLQDFRFHPSACVHLTPKHLLAFASQHPCGPTILTSAACSCQINYPLIRGICMSTPPFFPWYQGGRAIKQQCPRREEE